jgi:hypothetical protein
VLDVKYLFHGQGNAPRKVLEQMSLPDTIDGMNKDAEYVMDISMNDYIRYCKYYDVGSPDECWEWKGYKNENGYGMFRIRRNHLSKHIRAHRIMFYLRNANLPEDVHHECENTACVNPNHLVALDHAPHVGMHHRGEKSYRYGKGYLYGGVNSPLFGKPRLYLQGSKGAGAKLTDDQAREVHRLRKEGKTYLEIGNVYGITKTTVMHLLKGDTWNYIYREFYPEE